MEPVMLDSYTWIEFSKDGGATWGKWVYWEAGLTHNPPEATLKRLTRLYPEWQFRRQPEKEKS